MLLGDHVDLAVDGGVALAFTARTFTGFAGDDIAFDVGQGMAFALALAPAFTFALTARAFTGFAGDDIAFDIGQGMA